MTTGIRALPFVLLVTAGSQHAFAQHFICYPIRPGDTAAHFALRLTGSVQSRHAPWFRIIDPTKSRIIPKAEYGLVLPGWHVCVAKEMLRSGSMGLRHRTVASARAQSIQTGFTEKLAAIDLRLLWWTAPLLVVAFVMLLARLVTQMYFGERQAILEAMRRFGDKFVREFERPLSWGRDADPPIRSRLRFAPNRERLEVLLAPRDGRTYPNLSDHRKNLEYDVERVLHLVGDEPFIRRQCYAEGRWVVIPFQLKTDVKQEGVT